MSHKCCFQRRVGFYPSGLGSYHSSDANFNSTCRVNNGRHVLLKVARIVVAKRFGPKFFCGTRACSLEFLTGHNVLCVIGWSFLSCRKSCYIEPSTYTSLHGSRMILPCFVAVIEFLSTLKNGEATTTIRMSLLISKRASMDCPRS